MGTWRRGGGGGRGGRRRGPGWRWLIVGVCTIYYKQVVKKLVVQCRSGIARL